MNFPKRPDPYEYDELVIPVDPEPQGPPPWLAYLFIGSAMGWGLIFLGVLAWWLP